MYRIRDYATGGLIEEVAAPIWLRQQKLVDRPIGCDTLEEADGLYLSDDETMVGIAGRGMENYPPLVTVEEFSGDPYILRELAGVKEQNTDIDTKLDAQQALTLTSLQGQADQYTTALNMQAQIDAQQQLNLTALQGIADLYAALLTLQTPTTTPETEE